MRFKLFLIPFLLALMALPARAATPEQIELRPGESASWVGATMTAVNHEGQCDGPANPCDPFKIDVKVPDKYWEQHDGGLMISIDGFKAPNEFDLYAQQEFGPVGFFGPAIYSSNESAGLPQAVFVPVPVGRVTVTVIPYEAVNANYHGLARLAVWPKNPPPSRTSAPLRSSLVHGQGYAPSVAIDPSSSQHVIAGYLGGSPDGPTISVSNDGGRSWRNRGSLPGYGETSMGYASAVSQSLQYTGNTAYAIVHQVAEDGDRVMLHTSTDGGSTWSGPSQVAWAPQPGKSQLLQAPTGDFVYLDAKVAPVDVSDPRLAIAGSTMVACWGETASPDAGWVFAEGPIPPIGTPSTGQPPMHIIVATRSTNSGLTWTPPQIVSGLPRPNSRMSAGEDPNSCDVTADTTGGFHIAWYDRTSSAIRLVNSISGTPLFSSPVTVASVSQPRAMNGVGLSPMTVPSLASSQDGSIGIAWQDPGTISNDVMFARSTDNGATWSPGARVTNDAPQRGFDHVLPALSAGRDGSYDIAFFDRRNDTSNFYFDAYFARTLDGVHWVNTRVSRKMFSGVGYDGGLICVSGCPSDSYQSSGFVLEAPTVASASDGSAVVLWRNVGAFSQPNPSCFKGRICISFQSQNGLMSTRIPFYQQFGGRVRHSPLR